jgi:tRNA pseudouridine55 synthase
MDGILIIDKDIGMYSTKVVEKVRRLIKGVKVGHLGTLDPICTGLLPLCIGKATRFSRILMGSDKVYRTKIVLGIETTTFDCEGDIVAKKDIGEINISKISTELKHFVGDIKQTPPFYSAKKYKGQPLYKYAREGNFISLEPVNVKIYAINLIDYKDGVLDIEVHCSAGTYIRSLAHDLGNRLGVGAHCKEIRRIKWKNYSEKYAVKLTELKSTEDCLKFIIPLNEVLADICGFIELEKNEIAFFKRGQDIPLKYFYDRNRKIEFTGDVRYVRAIDKGGALLGLFLNKGEVLHPYIVL